MEARELLALESNSLSVKTSVVVWTCCTVCKDEADWLKHCIKMKTEGVTEEMSEEGLVGLCQKGHGEFQLVP